MVERPKRRACLSDATADAELGTALARKETSLRWFDMKLDMGELRQLAAHQELQRQQAVGELGELVRSFARAVDNMAWAHRQMGILSAGNLQKTVSPMYQSFGEQLEIFTDIQHRFAQFIYRHPDTIANSRDGNGYIVILTPENVR